MFESFASNAFLRSTKMLKITRLIVLIAIALGSVGVIKAQSGTPAATGAWVDPCTNASTAVTSEATISVSASASSVSFEIILPNARGDRSFIDSAAAGAERAIKELGVKGKIIETAGVQEHDAAIRRAIQDKPTLVITIAVDSSTIDEIAQEFPNQKLAA